MPKDIIDKVVKHYLESHDFNGIQVNCFAKDAEHSAVKKLIAERKIDLIMVGDDVNHHIKRIGVMPVKDQLESIENKGFTGCLYPTPELLKELNVGENEESPYTQELMRGAPQLTYKYFDLRMLEWYRNDPRFQFEVDDVRGRIIQKFDTEIEDRGIIKDDLELFEFGFAYNSKEYRAVTAFLRKLYRLPRALQIEVKKHELEGDYEPHPSFHDTQVRGSWGTGISACSAFLKEKVEINKICKAIGKPPFFKTNHGGDGKRPDGFCILLRPTKKEFGDFALLLDQLLNDDIDYDFFTGDVDLHNHLTDSDGNPVKHSKGKIQLLEEWIRPVFTPRNPEDIEVVFKNFRDVRKARNRPAHNAENNEFDQKYIIAQRDLLSKAHNAVACLRIILQQHPEATNYKPPEYLDNLEVWLM